MLNTDKTQQTNNATQDFLPIVVGALAIDTTQNVIRVDETPLDVTPLEYKLLAYLGQNLGRIVSVDELLEEVWGCEAGGTKQQVKNCIWRLRQKIEPDCNNPTYIIVARGRGYYMPMRVDNPL